MRDLSDDGREWMHDEVYLLYLVLKSKQCMNRYTQKTNIAQNSCIPDILGVARLGDHAWLRWRLTEFRGTREHLSDHTLYGWGPIVTLALEMT